MRRSFGRELKLHHIIVGISDLKLYDFETESSSNTNDNNNNNNNIPSYVQKKAAVLHPWRWTFSLIKPATTSKGKNFRDAERTRGFEPETLKT